ncbi:efflux RND transporter periplasmic adaptor subunit [Phragmitibacter flavus]|uniref:Efflux RND transporter periplasmic adaptor subunit n=1 Tax=Phragmitibacter flavus TaxID=2576071 RepID=A0A5R8KB69_9BACT|nr:efflux RND transporter periplasmic adaptor subunit [Phragmitibacter flavus]TLD69165.1 efflux RND transporter periplasmic adaptor subunit [Phragmitibacter flavus]
MPRRLLSLLAWLALPVAAINAQNQDAPKPVTTAQAVVDHVVTTLDLTGTIVPKRQASLSSRASGLILKLPVDAGSTVKTGDVLMELDPALASLALERVTVETQQAQTELTEAQRLLDEVRELAKVGGFSKSEAQTRETAVRIQTANLARAQVQLREQKEQLARHQLIAPFDGVIRQKLSEEGEWVQTGTPVLELVETTHLHLDLQAPQEIYAQLNDNTAVTVHLDAYADTPLKAKVATRVPAKDPVSRTFLVRLDLTDPEKLAAPGMSARATLSFRSKDQALQIPRDAIVRFPNGTSKVWIVQNSDGPIATVRSQLVKTGQALNDTITILEGLEPGTTIILQGNESLREDQPVTILPAP